MNLAGRILLFMSLLFSVSCEKAGETIDSTLAESGTEKVSRSWEPVRMQIPFSAYNGLSVDEAIVMISSELDDWKSLDEDEKQYLINKIYVYLWKQEDYPISEIIKQSGGAKKAPAQSKSEGGIL